MLISLLPWMAFAEPAQEPPSPIPPLNDLLRLPSPVSLELAYVAEPTYSLPDSLFNYAHGFELAAQLSTGFGHDDPASWKEIDHWILTFDAQQYYSPSDLAADMGVVNPSQEIANPNGLYLGELSLTRSPGNDPIYLKVGSISMDADFLSPEITGMYTHAAFNNQYNVSMEVFPISPVNALGAVVGYSLPGDLDFKAGIYQQNSIRADMDRQGWEFDVNGEDGLVELIQLEGNIGDSPETIGL
ncbi:MAG: carbohydrate porin, partial [Myxococcota bacterium]|nr:carbohydrate porin [Myxococcota bacterium]